MVNRSKAKGTSAESAIARTLVEEGWIHAERRALHGCLDKGDIAGLPGVMIESKNEKTYSISTWLKEVAVETDNAKADVGVCWFKIPRKGDPREWAVLMTGAQFIEILKKLGYHPEGTR